MLILPLAKMQNIYFYESSVMLLLNKVPVFERSKKQKEKLVPARFKPTAS